MKTMRFLILFLSSVGLALAFQNCGKISSNPNDAASKLQVASHSLPHILATGLVGTNTDIEFSVHDDLVAPSASLTWSHKLAGVINACQVKTSNIARSYVLNCGPVGELTVSATITDGNMTTKLDDYVVTLTNPTPTPAPTLPPAGTPPPGGAAAGTIALTINFDIAAGTGNKPWNTANAPVEAFIGQTVKLNNLDSVKHRLHTGGAPCPHGADFAPGASTNCVITRSFAATGVVYDHTVGPAARFYIIAYDGNALYATNCAGCHGALAATTIPKKSVTDIQNALTTVPAMKANAAIQVLTRRQLEAIAFAVGAR